jgi:hypothetical protein
MDMSTEVPNRSGENPLRDSRPAKAAELAVPGAYAPSVRRWHDAVSGVTAYVIAETVLFILILGIVLFAR